MAPTFLAGLVSLLATVLPLFGIHVGSEQLTTTLQTLIVIGSGLVVLFRQVTTGRATVVGARPKDFQG